MRKLLVAALATFLAAGVYAKDITKAAEKTAVAAEKATAAIDKAETAKRLQLNLKTL